MNEKQDKEKFESFLAEVNCLPDFLIEKAENKGYNLDYSIDSLNELERYLSTENIKKDDEDQQFAAMYLGELIIKNYGGKWVIDLDDLKSLDFAIPIIKGHSKFDVTFNPFHAVSIYIIRKVSGILYKSIRADVSAKKLGLDSYPTEK